MLTRALLVLVGGATAGDRDAVLDRHCVGVLAELVVGVAAVLHLDGAVVLEGELVGFPLRAFERSCVVFKSSECVGFL